MIIERERFNSLTEEEIKSLCSKFNREIAKKFTIKDDDTFCIGSGVKIPLGMFNYKDNITREMLMTHEEFESEVRAGNVKGVGIDEKGRIYF